MAIKTRLEDMQIGDKIISKYVASSGVVGTFSELGSSTAPLIPAASSATPNGSFYWLKVSVDYKGRSILVADRNVAHSISWDKLNEYGVSTVSGVQITSLGLDPTQWKTNIRLLTGGISDATKANSEWDKYIENGPYPSDGATWSFNVSGIRTMTSTTPSTNSAIRVARGDVSVPNYWLSGYPTTRADGYTGFRPVLVAESLVQPIVNKYLVQDGSDIKTFLNNSWSVVGSAPATRAMFDQGMDDVSSLTPAALGGLTSNIAELLCWTDEVTPVRHVKETGLLWQPVSDVMPSMDLFLSDGMTDLLTVPADAWNLLTGDFDIIMYTNLLEGNQSVEMNAVPLGQVVFAETDFSTIDDLTVTASTNVKLIASGDSGVIWKTFTDSWQPITNDASQVSLNGMTPSVFNSLTTDQWAELGSNIRLGYYVEEDAVVDSITLTKAPVSTETPTLDSIKIIFDDLTIEGRMQDLEQLNAVNMAKLQFKSNSLLQSDKYELHDLVIDTFESAGTVEQTDAVYNVANKEFGYDVSVSAPAVQEVILPEEVLPSHRKKFMLNVDHAGNIDYEYSLDGGVVWSALTPFTIVDLTGKAGINLKVKAKLKDSTAKLRGIAFSWA